MELTWSEECWIKFCRQLIRERFLNNYYNQSYLLFIDWYNNRFLPLLWHFLLVPYRTNKFVYLRT